MDTIERKKKLEEMIGEVIAHVRGDLRHMESNLRLMRSASSDSNVDWYVGNIVKEAINGNASLQVMLKQMDEKGLTYAGQVPEEGINPALEEMEQEKQWLAATMEPDGKLHVVDPEDPNLWPGPPQVLVQPGGDPSDPGCSG